MRSHSHVNLKKRFSLKGHLAGHERIHIGEKLYRCKFCEKRFSVKGYLTGDKRTHTGDKSYQCKFCKKGFPQKGNFNEHDHKPRMQEKRLGGEAAAEGKIQH